MRGGVMLAVACAFVLAFTFPAGAAPGGPRPGGYTDPAYLVVAVDPPFAAWNDTVVLDVRTFVGPNPTDASQGPWLWSRMPSDPDYPVNFTRVGVGHYRGNLTLAPTLYDPLRAVVGGLRPVFVSANLSGPYADSLVSLPWVHDGAWVRAYLNRSYVAPGDRVRLVAEVLNGSQHVDAEAVTLHLLRGNPPGDQTFALTRVALGVYQVDLQVPQYDPLNEEISMGVSASYLGVYLARDVWFAQPGYQVWYHQTSNDAVASRGDLWIADGLGHAAAGVRVNLTLNNGVFSYINTTSDASGRVPVILPYGSLHLLDLIVHVGPSSLGVGPVLTLYPDGDPGFSAVAADPPLMPGGGVRDYLLPGEAVVRYYRAVDYDAKHAAVPQPNAEVSYVVSSGNGGASYGRTRTDADGLFSLSFTAPESDVSVAVFRQNRTPAPFYYEVASPRLGMSVSPLRLGEPTTIGLSAEGNLERFSELGGGYAMLQVLSSSSQDRWVPWGRGPETVAPLTAGPDGLAGDLRLPSFLPSDARYVLETGPSLQHSDTHQFAALGVGEAADIPIGGRPSPQNPNPWVTWAAVAGVTSAVAVTVAAVLLYRRMQRGGFRRKVPPPHP